MKDNVLILDFFMEIKKNFPRFLSILLIVTLGVAFYSGVSAVRPDMEKSLDRMYDQADFMDFRIVNTLGLTREDLEAVKSLEGVKAAEGVYKADLYCDLYANTEEEEQEEELAEETAETAAGEDTGRLVLQLYSMTDTVNQVILTEGRMPERVNECVIDEQIARDHGLEVGQYLYLSAPTGERTTDYLSETQFLITGIGIRGEFLTRSRGTTSLGDGTADGFMICIKNVFVATEFSEIDVAVADAKELQAFSGAYDDKVKEVMDRVEEIQGERSRLRYDEVKQKAEQELADAQSQLDSAQRQLDDSKNRLDQTAQELETAKAQIQAQMQEIVNGNTTIEQQEQALSQSYAALSTTLASIEQAQSALQNRAMQNAANQNQISASQAQLQTAWKQYQDQVDRVNEQANVLSGLETQLEDMRKSLEEKQGQLNALQTGAAVSERKPFYLFTIDTWAEELDPRSAGIDPADPGISVDPGTEPTDPADPVQPTDLPAATDTPPETTSTPAPSETQTGPGGNDQPGNSDREKLEGEITQLQSQISSTEGEIATKRAQLDSAQAAINETYNQLTALDQQLQAQAQALAAEAQAITADSSAVSLQMAEYTKQKATLDASSQALAQTKQMLENGQVVLNNNQLELTAAENELAQGRQSYEAAVKSSKEHMEDATRELNDKKRQVARMEDPKWYILDRNSVEDFASYGEDAERIGAIGNVVPLIFFLVAALVSLATITRMVEEQRTQMGVLKALGYDKKTIAVKYVLYALLATVIGAVIGLILGQLLLPRIIINAYRMMYCNLTVLRTPLSLWYSLLSTVIAIACTVGAAFAACYHSLRLVPAQLMRPEAPKYGKKIFLEQWKWFWSKCNFSWKAAIRNMARYKKRLIMTVFGIAACMALLLIGFGLKDSISVVGEKQFGELHTYDGIVTLDTTDARPVDELDEKFAEDERVTSWLKVYAANVDAGVEDADNEKSAAMYVISHEDLAKDFFVLRDRASGQPLELSDDGVIITEKLAKLMNVRAGDTIYLMDNDNYKVNVTVTGITENYYRHYIYMNEACYNNVYKGLPEYNQELIITTDRSEEAENQLMRDYLAMEAVSSVNMVTGFADRISDMLKNLDAVVYVIIVAAALLAVVVLYNLNNINITERRRELATMKVLGFHGREVTMYVLRENIIMTVFGILIGLLLGIILHRFVIQTAELDLVMFGRAIYWPSYLLSVVLTIVFSIGVNALMYFKLKKIDMVESLKSVE